ncbi:MAG TPA: phosphoadenylyl-sulfate reductase [Candidatus Nitrosotenuis sp.]|nr:phosphoadenylyl-sulfate reductase [Candidatus Nitrosotenuis sp.]HIH45740.1 phosphoadenylyl-sulfate reductase [Candidatus Nitrosotenuis sp.]HIH68610.1 phosphoadenylyl-sulfate reductase [Candidatus Nitrosotenuis sp.]HII03838.1 phosphoadenylyl-sulfate reductase [Candidatus Nitrosotenuis sp.]
MYTQEQIDEVNSKLKTPEDALKWAYDTFGNKIAKASSFGPEDSVVTDMIIKVNPKARFFTLDTGRLNQETYDVMDAIAKKYNINFEVMFPETVAVEEMVRTKGINLFYDSVDNRKLCCEIRKVRPLNKILSTLDAWVTGLRRDQNENRSQASMVELDHLHGGIVKINPIIDWTWEQVISYIKERNLPYNKLLDKGFTSIGCEPCTRAIKPGENLRAGRWWWESDTHKECGLHMKH